MKIKFIAVIAASLALVGCRDQNDPETRIINQKNASNPEFVADTPKGKLYRIKIDIGSGKHNDRIYFFENSNDVTVNQTVAQGKNHHTQATVIVNGKEYVPKP